MLSAIVRRPVLLGTGLVTLLVLQIFQRSAYADDLPPALKARRLVVSIGIDQFQDSLWHPLRYSSLDAKSLYSFFQERATPGFDGGALLTSEGKQGTGPGNAVTKNDVMNSLERLKRENRSEDDVVVVYVSSHGTVAYKSNGRVGRYIITSDTRSDKILETAVDYDELVAQFNSLVSRKKVLILAFCHSGVGKSVLTPDMKRALAMIKSPYFEEPLQDYSEGSYILTASGWREPALEDEALHGDVYTHFLLEGLGIDQNKDGVVTITEGHHYAAEKTFQYTQGKQRPSAIVEQLGSDPIVVKGKAGRTGTAMLYSFSSNLSKLKVFVNNEAKGMLGKGISIPDGPVKLTFQDSETGKIVAEKVVHAREGREYSATELLQPSLDQSLIIGLARLGTFDRETRQQLMSADVPGIGLEYRRENGLVWADAIADLGYFPEQKQTIQSDDGEEFPQRSWAATVGLSAGIRQRLAGNTTKSGYTLELGEMTGPHFLYIHRSVDDPSFNQTQHSSWIAGWSAGLGLTLTLPYYLAKFSVFDSITTHRRFAGEGSPLTLGHQFGVGLGTFW